MRWWVASSLLLLMVACSDSGGGVPGGSRVIVQETNADQLPDAGVTSCTTDHQEHRFAVRSCDDQRVKISICSSEPLCEAQIAEITAMVTACEQPTGEFAHTPSAECG